MKLFRSDPQAGLKKAEAALTATEARLAELASDRAVALRESDDVGAVQKIDAQIAATLADINIHKDRIIALRAALKEQQAEQTEQERQKAIGVVEQRGTGVIEVARRFEHHQRAAAAALEELYGWGPAITSAWPSDLLARPLASDFHDQRDLKREVAVFLYSLGKPSWNRDCFFPAPAAPIPVAGLQPKGVVGYVTFSIQNFLARLKAQRTDVGADEDTEAAA